MDFKETLTIIAAVWGIVFTFNSALSAVLQTKWMFDQRKLLKEMRDALNRLAPQDLQKQSKNYLPFVTGMKIVRRCKLESCAFCNAGALHQDLNLKTDEDNNPGNDCGCGKDPNCNCWQ